MSDSDDQSMGLYTESDDSGAGELDEVPIRNELQVLLSCLRGLPINVTPEIVKCTRFSVISKKYGDYFHPAGVLPERVNMRKTVLEAIGCCSSIISFDEFLLRLHECTLTVEEWETLLSPLQFSPSLIEVKLYMSTDYDHESRAIRGRLWGQVFKSSQTIKRLVLSHPVGEVSLCLSEIARGLRANSNSALQELDVSCYLEKNNYLPVIEIIDRTRKLQSLTLRLQLQHSSNKLLEDESTALVSSFTGALTGGLTAVKLDISTFMNPGFIEVLTKSFSERAASKSVLKELTVFGSPFDVKPDFRDAWAALMGCKITQVTCMFKRRWMPESAFTIRVNHWDKLGAAVVTSSEPNSPTIDMESYGSEAVAQYFTKVWEACQLSHEVVVSAYVDMGSPLCTEYYRRNVPIARRYDFLTWALAQKFLRMLSISYPDLDDASLQQSLANLKTNSSISKLEVKQAKESHNNGWNQLFEWLSHNESVKHLYLTECRYLSDTDFKDLMGLLEVNTHLATVEIKHPPWANDGKLSLIEEALARNKHRAAYLATMRGGNLRFDRQKAGRILLCGFPHAGKSRLKTSLIRACAAMNTSRFKPRILVNSVRERLEKRKLWRTMGIEVDLLSNGDNGKVFIWDLAGQYIFRALQDLVFPRNSQSCVFVFVFSPFVEDTQTAKDNVYEAFRTELSDWLKFIVSSCQVTGNHVPQVLVVLTHKDLLKKCGHMTFNLDRIKDMMLDLRQRFHGAAEVLCDDLHHVDATSKRTVIPIASRVLELIDDLLKRKTHQVPIVCSQLISEIVWSKGVKACPVWTSSKFYDFCRETQKVLKRSSVKVLHAIALYLHDVGSIIMVSNRNGKDDDPWIVVDPNWLTENFLGEMISHGRGFDAQRGRSSRSWDVDVAPKGFIDEPSFRNLVDAIVGSKKNEGKEIDKRIIEELMHGLELYYEVQVDSRKQYFIPIICGNFEGMPHSRGRRNELSWEEEHKEGCRYLGYRVQCQDTQRTSFSASFFPRLQIHLRKRLIETFGIIEGNISCSRGFMKVRHDSYEIYLENDETKDEFIDIMVKSSPIGNYDAKKTIRLVNKYIVDELRNFCASPKGCPGISLVIGVIRTASVKDLVPLEDRKDGNHCVMMEVVKRSFRMSIEQLVEDLDVDFDVNSALNFQFQWPAGGSDLAREVLDSGDMEEVLTGVLQRVEDYALTVHEDLTQLRQKLKRWGQEAKRCSQEAKRCSVEQETGHSSNEETDTSPLVEGETSTPEIRFADKDLTRAVQFLAQKMGDVGNMVGKKVDELASDMRREFRLLEKHIDSFRSELREMHSTLSTFNSEGDKIMNYLKSREDHSSPRRPYFTLKVDLTEKLKSFVLPGRAVCLHFMCEARNRPHFVADQPGFSFRATEKDNEWVPFIFNMSVKMIYMLLSTGVQISTGLGSLVPDFSDLNSGTSVPLSTENLDRLRKSSTAAVDPPDAKAEVAWSSLHSLLASKLAGNYNSLFKLHQVRYKRSDDPYAWLCETCLERGVANRTLNSIG